LNSGGVVVPQNKHRGNSNYKEYKIELLLLSTVIDAQEKDNENYCQLTCNLKVVGKMNRLSESSYKYILILH
jgi:hypothetical protein